MPKIAETFSYSELAITIYPGDPGKFKVRASSDRGSLPQPADLELPVSSEELPGVLEALSRAVLLKGDALTQTDARDGRPVSPTANAPTINPREFGVKLYNALFRGNVQRLLDLTRGSIETDNKRGLRIRLTFEDSRADMIQVMSLPWELLAESTLVQPIAVSRRYPIVRALDVMLPATPARYTPPFKVLVIVASPKNLPPLNLEAEQANLKTEWSAHLSVNVTWMRGVYEDVKRFLNQEDPHVLHFMGHGDFRDGQGVLMFETPEGDARPVSGTEFGMLLKDEPSLRLVFLNACKTAIVGGVAAGGAFAGVATALVRSGVTAVLAMQFPISDRAAIVFSNTFYGALIDGQPVDAAVGEARKEVYPPVPMHSEWATPVLFMRSPDGVLFDRPIIQRATGTFAVPGTTATFTTQSNAAPGTPASTAPATVTTSANASAPPPVAPTVTVQVAPPATTTTDFTVVMAAAADTVRSFVRRASKLLSEKGVTIVSIDLSAQAEHDAATRVLAASADLFVHFFGAVPGEQVYDAPRGVTYPISEFRIAAQEARAQLVALPTGLTSAGVSDDGYRQFLKDEIESRPRSTNRFEVVTADDGDTLAAEILKKRDALLTPPPAPQPLSVCLDVHQRDFAATMPLQILLGERGVVVRSMPSGDSPPREAIALFEQNVRSVPLVLVLVGGVGESWAFDRARIALLAGMDRDPQTRVVIVRLPGSAEIKATSKRIDVIGDGIALPESAINALLDEAARSSQ